MLSVSGVAGLLLAGAGCGGGGSSGGTGGKGGAGGAAGAGGAGGGAGGAGGAHDAGAGGTGGAQDAAVDQLTDASSSPISFTFNTDAEVFMLDTFPSTSPVNLAATTPDGGASPTLAFDGTTGMPAAGSLKITATFTDYNQMVTVMRDFTGGTLNVTGKTITAQVMLGGAAGAGDGGATDGGGTPASSAFSGFVVLFAQSAPPILSTTIGYAESDPIGLTDNAWHTLTFNLTSPHFMSGFLPGQVEQLGIKILSPQPAADGGASAFGSPEAITIHFDTLVSN
jgi:hypothetical protein